MEVKGSTVSFEIAKPDCRTCKQIYLGHTCLETVPCINGDKYQKREPLYLWSPDAHLQSDG